MKRIHTILSIILALSLFSSCNYLDIKPVGQVIPERVSEFRALMVQGYNGFPVYKDLLALRSDEVFPYNGEYGSFDVYVDLAVWNENGPKAAKAYPWVSMYQAIFYANTVIAGVMGAEVDNKEDAREQMKAEALLLRAYAHFELLNLYAKPYNSATSASDKGVPVATKIDVEQNFVPASVEEVYEQIFADLEEAKPLLNVEEQPVSLRYRFSKKSAMALEARIRLYRSEWNLALEAVEKLLPSCELEDLNDTDAKSPYYYNSRESILALEQIANRDMVNGDMFVLPAIMDKYNKEKDQRVARYFKLSGGDYISKKGSTDDMKVTFRSGEMYLIAAEAAAHMNGKTDIAKGYLKQLIVNRLTPDYYAVKAAEIDRMNQSQLITEIAEERARELALEGHRWFDLRRTIRPEIVKTYKDQDNKERTVVLMRDDPRYTIPFPREATENNPNLND